MQALVSVLAAVALLSASCIANTNTTASASTSESSVLGSTPAVELTIASSSGWTLSSTSDSTISNAAVAITTTATFTTERSLWSSSSSSSSMIQSTPRGPRFSCLYADGASELYSEQIDGTSTVFKCLMGTKCYQTGGEQAEIRCAYPENQVSSVTTSDSDGAIGSAVDTTSNTQTTDQLGQNELGFHNNRYIQALPTSQPSPLLMPAGLRTNEQSQIIPTSSEPRVLSVNIILPTIAIRFTDDMNARNIITVLSVDPMFDVMAELAPAIDSLATFAPLPIADWATSAPTPSAKASKLLPIFSVADDTSVQRRGRMEMLVPGMQTTILIDEPDFSQSLVTFTFEKGPVTTNVQRHEITIDDFDLAGILRITKLAAMATKLLKQSSTYTTSQLQLARTEPYTFERPTQTIPTFAPMPPLPPPTPAPTPTPTLAPVPAMPSFAPQLQHPRYPLSPVAPRPQVALRPHYFSRPQVVPRPFPAPRSPVQPQQWSQPPPYSKEYLQAHSGQRGLGPLMFSQASSIIVFSDTEAAPTPVKAQNYPPQPLPVPQLNVAVDNRPNQLPSGLESALVTLMHPNNLPQVNIVTSSSPYNVALSASARHPVSSITIRADGNDQPFNLQNNKGQLFTPIIPFISDGTTKDVPTPKPTHSKKPKDEINASGIASILQNVFHIPASAISIDGRPLLAESASSDIRANGKDSDDEVDDDEVEEESEKIDVDAEDRGRDLEQELRSRLGISEDQDGKSSRIRAHIKLANQNSENKGRASTWASRHNRFADNSDNANEVILPTAATRFAVIANETARRTVQLVEQMLSSEVTGKSTISVMLTGDYGAGFATNIYTHEGVDFGADSDVEFESDNDDNTS
ncbi:hypothetical protein LPJ66_004303 [Kickxella alabastrina]|uniref:Uncharacterized protein n=1 Tax=Kickxella alabastrina TaxID=61397 RepID=A0ACC1IHN9_9FUNG|nr:hypothetical protein LPJ66_004303 [Kickxella alabastrina]